MQSQEIFSRILADHKQAVEGFFAQQSADLELLAQKCTEAFKANKKIILCGNGGSASDAQHIAAEFVGRFLKDRQALPSIALTTDTSILTAVGNDYGYDYVFSRQVEALGQEGDIFIGISTSGNSGNVIKAVEAAKEKGIYAVVLSGRDGGALKEYADMNLIVPSDITAHIQETHIMALHTLCTLIEVEMGFQQA